MSFKVPNEYRFRDKSHPYGSDDTIGKYGVFDIPFESNLLHTLASEGMGWEHVSVSLRGRCPNWREMCFVKSLFWDDEDVVIQYHPKKSEYVNVAKNCLHLWRPIGVHFPTPPKVLVG